MTLLRLAVALLSLASACLALSFTNSEWNVIPGKPFEVKWASDDGKPVTLSLMFDDAGLSSSVLIENDPASSFTWSVPSNIKTGRYYFHLVDADGATADSGTWEITQAALDAASPPPPPPEPAPAAPPPETPPAAADSPPTDPAATAPPAAAAPVPDATLTSDSTKPTVVPKASTSSASTTKGSGGGKGGGSTQGGGKEDSGSGGKSGGDEPMSTGAKAGIAVGTIGGVAVFAAAALLLFRVRRKRRRVARGRLSTCSSDDNLGQGWGVPAPGAGPRRSGGGPGRPGGGAPAAAAAAVSSSSPPPVSPPMARVRAPEIEAQRARAREESAAMTHARGGSNSETRPQGAAWPLREKNQPTTWI